MYVLLLMLTTVTVTGAETTVNVPPSGKCIDACDPTCVAYRTIDGRCSLLSATDDYNSTYTWVPSNMNNPIVCRAGGCIVCKDYEYSLSLPYVRSATSIILSSSCIQIAKFNTTIDWFGPSLSLYDTTLDGNNVHFNVVRNTLVTCPLIIAGNNVVIRGVRITCNDRQYPAISVRGLTSSFVNVSSALSRITVAYEVDVNYVPAYAGVTSFTAVTIDDDGPAVMFFKTYATISDCATTQIITGATIVTTTYKNSDCSIIDFTGYGNLVGQNQVIETENKNIYANPSNAIRVQTMLFGGWIALIQIAVLSSRYGHLRQTWKRI